MTLPLFFAPEVHYLDEAGSQEPSVPLGDVTEGSTIGLEGSEAHHIVTVRRLRVGEELYLTDGEGTKVLSELIRAEKNVVELQALQKTKIAPFMPQVCVVQALAKGGRDEAAVELCTELGANSFIPWQAERSIVRWEGRKEIKGKEKWENTVLAATKQSRQSFLPRVSELVNTAKLASLVQELTASGGRALLCHEEGTEALTEVLPNWGSPQQVWIIVGPEGGISGQEVSQLVDAGATLISLGSPVLRSSTAAAATLSMVNYVSGRIWAPA